MIRGTTARNDSALAVQIGVRTPQAKAFGKLARFSAVDLGKHVISQAMQRADLQPEDIDEVIFGNVAGPPDAANIARVMALKAGIPHDRIAHSVHRNCASGMESLIGAWQALREGRAERILAGGTESMSNIPLLYKPSYARKIMALARAKSLMSKASALLQFRRRDFKPTIGVELGLTDPTCGLNMGQTAEILAKEFAISRDDQDRFAMKSHQRAVAASDRCFMSGEIAPLASGDEELKLDVGPRESQSMQQLGKLRPIFKKDGSVTAGNSCPLTDGATCLVLADAKHADSPLGFVTAYAIAGCDPRRMGLGPVFATSKLLKDTGLALSDFDLFEINEAFAAQVLACLAAFESDKFAQDHLGRSKAIGVIDREKLNIHGGGIALGHPVGASGARIVLTLLRALREKNLKRGLATLCVGGGQGVAMVVESP
ncbi:MAG: thiolase family protein [Aureliella sp.]